MGCFRDHIYSLIVLDPTAGNSLLYLVFCKTFGFACISKEQLMEQQFAMQHFGCIGKRF